MDIPTIVNIVLSVLSFILCVISIYTSVRTLRQNEKTIQLNYDMLESSTRPYLGIYTSSSNIGKNAFFIILKNFGNSPANVTEFSPSVDLSKISLMPQSYVPFSGLIGSTIMPGQSIRTAINYQKAIAESETIEFAVKYLTPTKKEYEDTLLLKLTSNSGNLVKHYSENELSTISETLQEMHIRSL